ncbi:hypothetical protein [Curvibacter sp. AEP1-3]|uniref:hypothetical protein n=1 Tax=Curvibacter sp. AEP1-3 TaxID=1844971 RepID=UPI0012F95A26|nr:hypothetical protein [Curvibacter sp. AEP1-3]
MPKAKTWAIFTPEGNARMWSMFQSHVQKLADAEGLTVTPLYDKQALIDSLEEAAKECDSTYYKYLAEDSGEVLHGIAACAATIRKLKETL